MVKMMIYTAARWNWKKKISLLVHCDQSMNPTQSRGRKNFPSSLFFLIAFGEEKKKWSHHKVLPSPPSNRVGERDSTYDSWEKKLKPDQQRSLNKLLSELKCNFFFVRKHRLSTKIGTKCAKTCVQRACIPTELPFWIPPLVVGKAVVQVCGRGHAETFYKQTVTRPGEQKPPPGGGFSNLSFLLSFKKETVPKKNNSFPVW